MLAGEGILTARKPAKEELAAIDYGRRVAHALAGFDIGQSVAIAAACIVFVVLFASWLSIRRVLRLEAATVFRS